MENLTFLLHRQFLARLDVFNVEHYSQLLVLIVMFLMIQILHSKTFARLEKFVCGILGNKQTHLLLQ